MNGCLCGGCWKGGVAMGEAIHSQKESENGNYKMDNPNNQPNAKQVRYNINEMY